jgi:hypothetical protein
MMDEVLAAFEGMAVRRYVDGTLGAAGHASAMLRQHPELEALVGFDLDPTAHQLATARLAAAGAAVVPVAVSAAGQAALGAPTPAPGRPAAYLVRANFGSMHRVLQQLPLDGSAAGVGNGTGGTGVDAILLDLGISSMQVARTPFICHCGCARCPAAALPLTLPRPLCGCARMHTPTPGAPLVHPLPTPPIAARWTPRSAASPSCATAPWTCAWTPGRR